MQKRPEAFIPPLMFAIGILLLLFVARFYEHLPIKPPECNLKRLTGIPCVSCGGTRAFQALSRGQIVAAFRFNPAATAAVFAAAIWMVMILIRKDKPDQQALSPDQRRKRTRFFIIAGVLIFVANWIYLIYYLE